MLIETMLVKTCHGLIIIIRLDNGCLLGKATYKVLGKLEERYIGPYLVVMIHVNGTLTVRKRPNVLERINVRRVKPFNGSIR